MKIAIVAGEASGDQLGADLMRSLREKLGSPAFFGIGGEKMIRLGFDSLYPSERLAVMGFTEVMGRYLSLVRMRKRLIKQLIAEKPDVFIGIDAPDFNLEVERQLKAAGIKTVHYVSPSVWAWRRGRLPKIAAAVDHMLTLFPFEAKFYEEHNVPVTFVGHPLADIIPFDPERSNARGSLDLPRDKRIVAVLPGSRVSEVKYLTEPFLQTAEWLSQRYDDLLFVVPIASAEIKQIVQQTLQAQAPQADILLLDGQSHQAMSAADVVLLASGTATLEALLLNRPMVVAYRQSAITHAIYDRMIYVDDISLPNLLAGKPIVEEFLQDEVTPESLGVAVAEFLDSEQRVEKLTSEYHTIRQQLCTNASDKAADAIIDTVNS